MHRSRIGRTPLIKSFSLRKSTNFSNRNILKKHKRIGLSKPGEDEIESQDMEITDENNENESNDNSGNFREDRNEDTFEMKEEDFREDRNEDSTFEMEENYDFRDFREDRNEDTFEMEEENYETEDIEEDYNFREEGDNNNDSSESDNNNNMEEDLIIDASMDINQMLNNNDGASYFETSTSALLFCWVQKHNISTNAYNDLADILQNPAFNASDVVKNVRRLWQWRHRLPLMPIRSRPIKINRKKTPSTSKEIKPSYYLSITDIIWNILNNPTLYDTLYFGPGIESETKKEYWHGDLWAESPLFGQDKIIINHENYCPGEFVIYKEGNSRRFGRIRSIISINNELRIKIQRVYIYNELPNHFYSNARSNTQEWQLWLVDQYLKEGSIIINLNEIVKKTDITIIRNTCNTNGLYIKEILYKNNGHWKLRNVNLDYMHPSEYSVLSPPPSQPYKK
ncbi:unnamed protein product [Rhizophagus irregularis]|nr:unnamed protein product [Rhizophagus irregularis]